MPPRYYGRPPNDRVTVNLRPLALLATAALLLATGCSSGTSASEAALSDLEDAAGTEFTNFRDATDQVCPDIGCTSAALSDQVEITEWPTGTDLTVQYDQLYDDSSRGVERIPFIMYVGDPDWSGTPNYGALMNDIAQNYTPSG